MTSVRKSLLALLFCAPLLSKADDSLPGSGFDSRHYESLSKNSPFAVATPEASQVSVAYELVGVARCGGIDYASVVDKQTKNRVLLWREKGPNKTGGSAGLALIAITGGQNQAVTSAIVTCNGRTITLTMPRRQLLLSRASTAAAEPTDQVHSARALIIPP